MQKPFSLSEEDENRMLVSEELQDIIATQELTCLMFDIEVGTQILPGVLHSYYLDGKIREFVFNVPLEDGLFLIKNSFLTLNQNFNLKPSNKFTQENFDLQMPENTLIASVRIDSINSAQKMCMLIINVTS